MGRRTMIRRKGRLEAGGYECAGHMAAKPALRGVDAARDLLAC
jgi:hypothetical protein